MSQEVATKLVSLCVVLIVVLVIVGLLLIAAIIIAGKAIRRANKLQKQNDEQQAYINEYLPVVSTENDNQQIPPVIQPLTDEKPLFLQQKPK